MLHGLYLALLGIAVGLVLGLVVTTNLEAFMRVLDTRIWVDAV